MCTRRSHTHTPRSIMVMAIWSQTLQSFRVPSSGRLVIPSFPCSPPSQLSSQRLFVLQATISAVEDWVWGYSGPRSSLFPSLALRLTLEPRLAPSVLHESRSITYFNVNTWRCRYFTKVAALIRIRLIWLATDVWYWLCKVKFDHEYSQNNIPIPRPSQNRNMPDKYWSRKDQG